MKIKRINLFVLWLVALSTFLIFLNLDNTYLWQDEAETALLAKSILVHGIPKAYDGHNLISQEFGREYNQNYTWFWTPWLQFYLAAFSFLLLGINTFAARAPFALVGIGCVIATYYLGWNVSKEERVGRLSALFIIFNVYFLLHVRQCRYYSLLILFSVLTILFYFLVRQEKKNAIFLFFVSATLFFHSSYIQCLILLAILFMHWFLFDRKVIAPRKIFLMYSSVLVLNPPWFFLFLRQISKKLNSPNYLASIESLRIENLKSALSELDYYVLPLVILCIFLLIAFIDVRKNRSSLLSPMILLVEIIIGTILVFVFCLPYIFFRYIIGLVPLIYILSAFAINIIVRKNWMLGVPLFLLLCFTNIRFPYTEVGDKLVYQPFPILNYLKEVFSLPRDPTKGLVEYLKKDPTLSSKTIAITYGDLPLKFYTPATVIGGLTGQSLSAIKNADYAIIPSHVVGAPDEKLSRYFLENIPFENYEPIELDSPDYLFGNIPEPYYHRFQMPSKEKLIVYKKINRK